MAERKGILEEIGRILNGYGAKENLREADKKLRNSYASDFNEMRRKWESVLKTALDKNLEHDDIRKSMNLLDRLSNKVEHADYGYSGLLDRKGSVREEELKVVLEFDTGLSGELEEMKKNVGQIYIDCENSNFGMLPENAKIFKNELMDFESKWNEREKHFGREV